MTSKTGIMTLPEVKLVLSTRDRDVMLDGLKRLYSWDFLGGLNDDQILNLFEEMIELPGLTHIGYEKPPKPNNNVIPFPTDAITDWWRPRPGDPDGEEI
jgi:hypothetical protein|tara:strand:- start:218 stop:514 length:297 start_codon:yes stop_codon:yes gene_type:complete